MKQELTPEKYRQMVDDLIPKKAALKLIVDAGVPFEKWHPNVISLIDKELGITRRTIMEIEVQSPTPTTDKVEEQLREHAATWEEAVAHTKEDNSAMSKTAYLEQLENKLRKQ